MTKYTFLVPSYKVRFFRDALDSMMQQTYDDYLIVVSDDHSPENIGSIAKELRNSDKKNRIIYHRNEENIGGEHLAEHWNIMLKKCQSEYCIMASDDDVYDSHFLEEVDRLTRRYPEADVIRVRTQRIDEKGNVIASESILDEYQCEIEAIHGLLCENTIECIGNYVFKTEALKRMGGFVFFPYAWFSDAATVITMSKHGQANTSKTLFSFRLSGENISSIDKNRETERGKLKSTLAFDQWMGNYIQKISVDESKLHHNMLLEIKTTYKHRVYGHVGDYSWVLPIWKRICLYRELKSHKYFSQRSFLKYFGISTLNRKLSKSKN